MIVDPAFIIINESLRLAAFTKPQQSGIDVSLRSIRRVAYIKEDNTIVYEMILPQNGVYYLDKGCYDFECHEHVEVPQNMAALVITRSTHNRRGCFVTTGLYDNSFKNFVGGILHVEIPQRIPVNERIAQIVFFMSQSLTAYKGIYNEKGEK